MHRRLARQHHGADCPYSRAIKNALYSSSDRSAMLEDAKCAFDIVALAVFLAYDESEDIRHLLWSGTSCLHQAFLIYKREADHRVCTTKKQGGRIYASLFW